MVNYFLGKLLLKISIGYFDVVTTGHYWAYVHCPDHGGWMKFNDITVSEASWEELEKESIGGYHNASAYCLMYIDAKKCDSLLGK